MIGKQTLPTKGKYSDSNFAKLRVEIHGSFIAAWPPWWCKPYTWGDCSYPVSTPVLRSSSLYFKPRVQDFRLPVHFHFFTVKDWNLASFSNRWFLAHSTAALLCHRPKKGINLSWLCWCTWNHGWFNMQKRKCPPFHTQLNR